MKTNDALKKKKILRNVLYFIARTFIIFFFIINRIKENLFYGKENKKFLFVAFVGQQKIMKYFVVSVLTHQLTTTGSISLFDFFNNHFLQNTSSDF